MTLKVQIRGGKVLLVGGKVSVNPDCCCGCPKDCKSCSISVCSVYIVAPGISTGGVPWNPLNIDIPITRTGCTWYGYDNTYGVTVKLSCGGGGWITEIDIGADIYVSISPGHGVSACPPTGGYEMSGLLPPGGGASAGTVSVEYS